MEWLQQNLSLVIGIIIALIVIIVAIVLLVKKNKKNEKEKIKQDELETMARNILAAMGGKENVEHLDFEDTRLRFEVKDGFKVSDKALKEAGVMNINRPSKKKIQVMVGPRVETVYEDVNQLL